MNNIFEQKVIPIASLVRKQCEEAIPSFNKMNFYFCSDLGGMCAIASYALKQSLSKFKIRSKMVVGSFDWRGNHPYPNYCNHCWLEVADKIIDITASQFDKFPSVYIVPKDDSKYKPFNMLAIKKEIGTLKKMQWPEEQTPCKKILNQILTKNFKNKLDKIKETDMILA